MNYLNNFNDDQNLFNITIEYLLKIYSKLKFFEHECSNKICKPKNISFFKTPKNIKFDPHVWVCLYQKIHICDHYCIGNKKTRDGNFVCLISNIPKYLTLSIEYRQEKNSSQEYCTTQKENDYLSTGSISKLKILCIERDNYYNNFWSNIGQNKIKNNIKKKPVVIKKRMRNRFQIKKSVISSNNNNSNEENNEENNVIVDPESNNIDNHTLLSILKGDKRIKTINCIKSMIFFSQKIYFKLNEQKKYSYSIGGNRLHTEIKNKLTNKRINMTRIEREKKTKIEPSPAWKRRKTMQIIMDNEGNTKQIEMSILKEEYRQKKEKKENLKKKKKENLKKKKEKNLKRRRRNNNIFLDENEKTYIDIIRKTEEFMSIVFPGIERFKKNIPKFIEIQKTQYLKLLDYFEKCKKEKKRVNTFTAINIINKFDSLWEQNDLHNISDFVEDERWIYYTSLILKTYIFREYIDNVMMFYKNPNQAQKKCIEPLKHIIGVFLVLKNGYSIKIGDSRVEVVIIPKDIYMNKPGVFMEKNKFSDININARRESSTATKSFIDVIKNALKIMNPIELRKLLMI